MIRINGVVWRVMLVPPFHPGLRRSNRTFALGCCDYFTRIIYISKDVQQQYLKKIICHELVHAAIFSYGIDLDPEEEERIADLIASYGKEIVDMTDKIFQKIKK